MRSARVAKFEFVAFVLKRSKRATKTNRKQVGPDVKPEPIDDEAYLEADSSSHTSGQVPTDIADIIADSDISEQRLVSSGFRPSATPFGRHRASGFAPFPRQSQGFGHRPPSGATKRSPPSTTRRPTSRPPRPSPAGPPPPPPRAKKPVGQSSSHHRTPHSVKELEISSNSLVGSGNFDVITGGVFRRIDSNFRQAPVRYSKPRDPLEFYFPSFNGDGFFSNFKDFADISRRNSRRGSSAIQRRPTQRSRHPGRDSVRNPIRNRKPLFD